MQFGYSCVSPQVLARKVRLHPLVWLVLLVVISGQDLPYLLPSTVYPNSDCLQACSSKRSDSLLNHNIHPKLSIFCYSKASHTSKACYSKAIPRTLYGNDRFALVVNNSGWELGSFTTSLPFLITMSCLIWFPATDCGMIGKNCVNERALSIHDVFVHILPCSTLEFSHCRLI